MFALQVSPGMPASRSSCVGLKGRASSQRSIDYHVPRRRSKDKFRAGTSTLNGQLLCWRDLISSFPPCFLIFRRTSSRFRRRFPTRFRERSANPGGSHVPRAVESGNRDNSLPGGTGALQPSAARIRIFAPQFAKHPVQFNFLLQQHREPGEISAAFRIGHLCPEFA